MSDSFRRLKGPDPTKTAACRPERLRENDVVTLPIKPLPVIERWDCHQCGVCCRGSIVPLSEEDVARLKSQNWDQHADFRGTPVMVRESWLGHDYRLAQRDDGRCVFLTDEGLCRIHKELGFEAKPLVCRMFPLQIVPRDNVAYVTIRRACPSAAADKGRPVAEQLDFARQLARERHLADAAPTSPPIKPGENRGWPAAKRLLQSLQRLLVDERFPMVRRLVHALVVCRLLENARTKGLDDDRLSELVEVLEQNAAGEVGDLFGERTRPSGAAAVLFRQTAAEFVRLHPRFIARPSWRERWRLISAAWSFARGRGNVPRLVSVLPETTFEQLEEPLGALDPAVYQPLNRMFETTAVSWSYALANRGGWSIIESARMLALNYPIALWLLRWISAGRKPLETDMTEIITTLDRGQGFAPLAGAKQRRRVRLLAQLEELERLVVWYGR
jgi:lysine-N-methylase